MVHFILNKMHHTNFSIDKNQVFAWMYNTVQIQSQTILS